MHTGYHILLLLVITVLIVVLDQYVRSREDNQETFEGFTNTDCSRTLLSGGSVNNSHKTALVCDGGYCKNSGGGNGCCIDIGAVAPVPTCTTINKHYIVRADDGSIINESKKVCEYKNSYSLNPLSGKPLCEYDEATKRCQPTKYYPKKPKQPDCGSYKPSSTGGGHHGKNNLYNQYEKCVSMVKQGIVVSRGTNGPTQATYDSKKVTMDDAIKNYKPSNQGAPAPAALDGNIFTTKLCKYPSDGDEVQPQQIIDPTTGKCLKDNKGNCQTFTFGQNVSGFGCEGGSYMNPVYTAPNKDGSCPHNNN